MSDWSLKAYHDPKAEPVATMWLQSSGSFEEYVPKLAEKAGLGAQDISRPSINGKFFYENGEIHTKKHFYNR
jgi:hypothetical protein